MKIFWGKERIPIKGKSGIRFILGEKESYREKENFDFIPRRDISIQERNGIRFSIIKK